MSTEEERVREVFGKPRGCAGKPEQDSDRGAEGAQGHLLPQDGVKNTPKTRQEHATRELLLTQTAPGPSLPRNGATASTNTADFYTKRTEDKRKSEYFFTKMSCN